MSPLDGSIAHARAPLPRSTRRLARSNQHTGEELLDPLDPDLCAPRPPPRRLGARVCHHLLAPLPATSPYQATPASLRPPAGQPRRRSFPTPLPSSSSQPYLVFPYLFSPWTGSARASASNLCATRRSSTPARSDALGTRVPAGPPSSAPSQPTMPRFASTSTEENKQHCCLLQFRSHATSPENVVLARIPAPCHLVHAGEFLPRRRLLCIKPRRRAKSPASRPAAGARTCLLPRPALASRGRVNARASRACSRSSEPAQPPEAQPLLRFQPSGPIFGFIPEL